MWYNDTTVGEKILGYDLEKIVVGIHAHKRMEQRKIPIEQIRETLRYPHLTLPRFEDNTQEFRRKIGDRTHFVVVHYLQTGKLKIVTTGWSREA